MSKPNKTNAYNALLCRELRNTAATRRAFGWVKQAHDAAEHLYACISFKKYFRKLDNA